MTYTIIETISLHAFTVRMSGLKKKNVIHNLIIFKYINIFESENVNKISYKYKDMDITDLKLQQCI